MDKYNINEIIYNNSNRTIYIMVALTDACNYDCYYCYNHKPRKNAFLDLNKLYTLLVYLNVKYHNYILSIELIGGEPTIHPDLFLFIKSIKEKIPNIKIGIFTNLSANINYYLTLIKYDINIIATWHSIKNNIYNTMFINKILKLYELHYKNVEIHVMYENKNCLISENVFNILQKLYSNIQMCLLEYNKKTNSIYFCKDNYYTEEQLNRYYSYYIKYAEKKIFITVKYLAKKLIKMPLYKTYNINSFHNFKHWKCNAGYNTLWINEYGDIYPCAEYGANKIKHSMLGNINTPIINLHNTICQLASCLCVWEVNKKKIFK